MLVRRLLVVIAGLVLMAGCGSATPEAPEQPAPSASLAPPTARTVEDLAAALPTTRDVPGAKKKLLSCSGTADCADTASVSFELTPSIAEEEATRRFGTYIIPVTADVTAKVSTDVDAAASEVSTARTQEEAFVGSFATQGEDLAEGYSFGEKGTGTLDDSVVGEWSGYVARRSHVLTSPEGGVDTPPLARTVLHISLGTASVKVTVSVVDDDQGPAESESLARQLATEYIARLS